MFAQRGSGAGNTNDNGRSRNKKQNQDGFDTAYWKDKECYHCHKKGHPSNHCPKKKTNNNYDDDKSVSTKTSKSSKSSKATSTSINKVQKKLKKSFATLSSKIQEMENESDISDSDDDDDEQSHFQTDDYAFHHAFHQDFEQRNIDVLFKKRGPKLNLALRNIILLDSQSTMDLFCNPQLVNSIRKSTKFMKLQSNGGTMTVRHKASITS